MPVDSHRPEEHMNREAAARQISAAKSEPGLGRQMLNKVPEVTIYFWVIKILCTTVGETAADFLNDHVGLGLTGTSIVMSLLLIGALYVQFRTRAYVPIVYWVAVVLISV